jgi:hypothetical protein
VDAEVEGWSDDDSAWEIRDGVSAVLGLSVFF